jgi:iron-sulfur cluster insertion protein
MIQVTEKAALKIKEISDAEGIGHYTIRVRVVGGGCAGFTHDMYYEDKIGELDEIVEVTDYYGTIKVVVDPLSFQYLEDVTIDYLDSQFGAGFKFINPAVTGSCGCGSSVSF